MKTYRKEDLDKYLLDDWVKRLMESELNRVHGDRNNRYDDWLFEIEGKRLIYADVYGDILRNELEEGTSVLDVGGGYTSLTRILSQNSRYSLMDFLAHGGKEFVAECQDITWIDKDWYETTGDDEYDIIISNDLFPDVDQRMELFLDKYIPICKEIRIVLTYYNYPRFYTTQRIDDPEIMTFLSWDGEITSMKLAKYSERLIDTTEHELDLMKTERESIYRNGSQVSCVSLKGDK